MSSKTGRACALAASALLAAGCMSVVPTEAFAIDETRTFTWANGTQQPQIPQTITGADGREYRLTNQSAPTQLGGAQTLSQQFNRTENSQIAPDQLGNIGSIVPASVHISQDGYDGNIPRTGINYTPVYRNESDHISTTRDAYGDTQDAARAALAQNINYNGRSLALADVQFEEARKDSTGDVVLWKAIGTYSVDVPRQVLDHYDVVANYAGVLTRTANNGDWQISAIYSADDVPTEEENKPEEQPENPDETPVPEDTPAPAPDENITEMPPQDMDGNVIDPSNFNTEDTITGYENPDASEQEVQEQSSLPIVPIAIGAGIVVFGGIAVGILVARRKKSSGSAERSEGVLNETSAIGSATAAIAAPVIIEDPQCQLIELIPIETVDDEGNMSVTYDQTPKAELEIEPSISADIPTVIYFPAMEDEDGNRIDFKPVPGAQYWIAIDEDTVAKVPNKEIIIASDDDKEIYRGILIDADGDLTDQMRLDTEHMTAVVNGTAEEGEIRDLSAELEYYDEKAEEILAQIDDNEAIDGSDFDENDFEDDDDFESLDPDALDFDDEDEDTDDFAFALNVMEDEEADIEDVEFVEEDVDDMFDDIEVPGDNDEDPFAAYGMSSENEGEMETEADFEVEDDIDYGIDLEPDVDDMDYPEDFVDNIMPEDEEDVLIDETLDDIDFEDEDLDVDEIDEAEDIETETGERDAENDDDPSSDDDGEEDDLKGFKDLLNSL